MEAHVGVVERGVIAAARTIHGRDHLVERRLQRRDRVTIGADGRQRRGMRLDDAADLGQLLEEGGPRRLVVLPGHDVRIEEIPGVPRRHPGADPGLGLDQPLGGEDLDRLAQRRPARRRRRIQGVARPQLAAQDTPAERVHNLAVQVAMRVAAGDRRHGRSAVMIILYPPCAPFYRRR